MIETSLFFWKFCLLKSVEHDVRTTYATKMRIVDADIQNDIQNVIQTMTNRYLLRTVLFS